MKSNENSKTYKKKNEGDENSLHNFSVDSSSKEHFIEIKNDMPTIEYR